MLTFDNYDFDQAIKWWFNEPCADSGARRRGRKLREIMDISTGTDAWSSSWCYYLHCRQAPWQRDRSSTRGQKLPSLATQHILLCWSLCLTNIIECVCVCVVCGIISRVIEKNKKAVYMMWYIQSKRSTVKLNNWGTARVWCSLFGRPGHRFVDLLCDIWRSALSLALLQDVWFCFGCRLMFTSTKF